MTDPAKEPIFDPPEIVETFDALSLFGPRWYFRIVATGNYEILAQSQRYKSPAARDATARRLARRLGTHIVEGKRR